MLHNTFYDVLVAYEPVVYVIVSIVGAAVVRYFSRRK